MVTNIQKINDNLKAYEETKKHIKRLKENFKEELRCLENQLSGFNSNVAYYKGLNKEDCKKEGLVFI